MDRHYVPESDKVLVSSKLLQGGETESILESLRPNEKCNGFYVSRDFMTIKFHFHVFALKTVVESSMSAKYPQIVSKI